MIVLPMVGRELKEASRRRSTYLVRLGAATLALALGTLVAVAQGQSPPGILGQVLFVSLVVLLQLYCLGVGIFQTADCLSEEKREGTLGLLFLTDLKGHDIVFGKLVATSLNAFYGALAVLPILAIPLLAGGVAPGDFGRTVLVALNNLFLSLAVGLFSSSVCRDERRSMNLTMLILLVLAAGLPLLGAMVCSQTRALGPYYPGFVILSPAFAASMAFQGVAADFARQYAGWSYFGISVGLLHGLGWLLLGAACWMVPRTWQDRPLTAQGLTLRRRLAEVDQGTGDTRALVRRRLLDRNPVLWLTGRQRLKGWLVWGFLAVLGSTWVLSAAYLGWRNLDVALSVVLLLAARTALKGWVASEAGRQFSLDRASGALEQLLSTPLSVGEILRGQRLALQRQFLAPSLAVLGLDLILGLTFPRRLEAAFYWGVTMPVFVADMLALVPVGMWQGLNSRRPNRAASAAFAQVVVLPGVLFGFLLLLISASSLFSMAATSYFPPLSWVAICVGVDLLLGLRASRQLRQQFRVLATTRFEAKGRRA